MGMHHAFIAVPAAEAALLEAFASVWPRYELSYREALASLDALTDWRQTHERHVSSREWTLQVPGVEVYACLQDGDWAVLVDPKYLLSADDQALADLSRRFGRCLSFVIETAGGYAGFAAYEGGALLRSIDSDDGEVRTVGHPLPEEADLKKGRYYMNETLALQRRFGFRFMDAGVVTPVTALAVIDRTDYGAVRAQRLAEQAQERSPKKPWWKLW